MEIKGGDMAMLPRDLTRFRARAEMVLQHQGHSQLDVNLRARCAADLAYAVLMLVAELERLNPQPQEEDPGP